MPNGRYEVRSFATDEQRRNVCAYGIFSATHTGQSGPMPPTGKSTTTDYVYVMQFDGGPYRSHDQDLERPLGNEGTWLGLNFGAGGLCPGVMASTD